MKKLTPPSNTDWDKHIKTAFTYKDGTIKFTITDDELKIISTIYDKYHTEKGQECDEFKSTLLSDELNNALEVSYNEIQEKGRLSKLREQLLLSTNRCPFCGISVTEELDHHLPKSIYKSLGIFSRNLVPSCHKCNNKKRTIVGIPHIYYDEYLDNDYFIAVTKMIGNALVIKYEISKDNITEEQFKILSLVFERINLNNRLLKETNTFLSSFSISIEEKFDNFSQKGVKEYLLKLHQQFINDFGINNWRTALMKSLANCDDFCNGGFKGYYQSLIQ
jgi:hypothetical protein